MKVLEANGSTYTTTEIKIKNTTFSVTVVAGELNYISILKKGGAWGSLGKRFANFDEAVKNYKNAQMKVELLKLELNF